MNAEKAKKIEKATGYTLLVIGLLLIIIPAVLAFSIFLSSSQIPQLVPAPEGQEGDLTSAFATFSNVCLIFFMFLIMEWAGSIITSRGVTMIKDVKLKLVRKNLDEAAKTVEETEEQKAN